VTLLFPWLTVGFLLPPISYPGYPGKQKKHSKNWYKAKKKLKNQCKRQKKKKNQCKIQKKAKVRHPRLSELFTVYIIS
jgi:hypothetical protein